MSAASSAISWTTSPISCLTRPLKPAAFRQVPETHAHHRQPLIDVIVKFAANASAPRQDSTRNHPVERLGDDGVV